MEPKHRFTSTYPTQREPAFTLSTWPESRWNHITENYIIRKLIPQTEKLYQEAATDIPVPEGSFYFQRPLGSPITTMPWEISPLRLFWLKQQQPMCCITLSAEMSQELFSQLPGPGQKRLGSAPCLPPCPRSAASCPPRSRCLPAPPLGCPGAPGWRQRYEAKKIVSCVTAPASAAAQWPPARGLGHATSPVSGGALLQPLSLPPFLPVPAEVLLLPLPGFQSMARD